MITLSSRYHLSIIPPSSLDHYFIVTRSSPYAIIAPVNHELCGTSFSIHDSWANQWQFIITSFCIPATQDSASVNVVLLLLVFDTLNIKRINLSGSSTSRKAVIWLNCRAPSSIAILFTEFTLWFLKGCQLLNFSFNSWQTDPGLDNECEINKISKFIALFIPKNLFVSVEDLNSDKISKRRTHWIISTTFHQVCGRSLAAIHGH